MERKRGRGKGERSREGRVEEGRRRGVEGMRREKEVEKRGGEEYRREEVRRRG